ncbi:MAG: Gfo/Idh/MocA family oxidoreductase [Oscillospiraceae bacterium]|nr:Gfo/Idh/MocA family oxidoreductase [Oscillospiraceae bacterium]
MKYVLIGCGRIAGSHIRAALDNDIEITAVCDILPENMQILLENFNFNTSEIKKYTDYKKLLDENKADIAAIATDSGVHAEIALYCIDRGINLIIEKPMAMSIEDAEKIINLSEKKGVKVTVCHQNRFNTAVQKMRAALEGGRFGKISHGAVNIRWSRDKNYYDQADWRGKWAQDGGTLMNQCIHGLDLLRWMMNDEIDTVYGVTNRRLHDYIEAEDIGVAVVKFKNGSVATIEGTVNVYPRNLEETLYLFGERGTVKIGGESANAVDIWDFADENDIDKANKKFSESTVNIYGNGHISVYADIIEAIKNDRQPYIDAYAGKDAVELVLAIYKSQKERRAVTLPLENFASIDMTGEF